MRREERRDFSERFLAFRRCVVGLVLGVRFALVNLKHGVDARLPQLAMGANRVAQLTPRKGGLRLPLAPRVKTRSTRRPLD
jgi:hypothetical protein